MPSSTRFPTRRRLLESTAALLGASALAGCGGSSEASSTGREGPNAEPPGDARTDLPHVSLRNPERAPIVFRESESPTDEPNDGETARLDDWRHFLVVDADDAESLSFADVDGVDEARRLLDETDFESESVYVERHAIAECYERELCWVRWTESRVETDYARILRDADEACGADAKDVVTTLVRLPAALDPDEVQSYGSSSGGACRTPDGERMATDEEGSA